MPVRETFAISAGQNAGPAPGDPASSSPRLRASAHAVEWDCQSLCDPRPTSSRDELQCRSATRAPAAAGSADNLSAAKSPPLNSPQDCGSKMPYQALWQTTAHRGDTFAGQ